MVGMIGDSVAFFDTHLLTISWTTTILFIALAVLAKWHQQQFGLLTFNVQINTLFISCCLSAFIVFRFAIKANSFMDALLFLFQRIFDGSYARNCLLLFWLICVLASILFCVGVNVFCKRSTTTHRKFFHFTISLVAISGLFYDAQLLKISAHLILQILLIIEAYRSLNVEPWASMLNSWLLMFIDEAQESSTLIMTPVLLCVGVFMPLLVGSLPTMNMTQSFFCGIQTVGVGDSFAAVIGTWLGATRWTHFSNYAIARKSIEGSLAMFLSQLLCMPLIYYLGAIECNFNALLLTALISTIVEAHLVIGDNLVLPLISLIIYYILV